MITTIGNTKGGVGKTTLAVNLAIGLARRGQDVLLIDGDVQETAIAFTQLRSTDQPNAPAYTAVALHGAAIRTQVRQLANRYQHIVVDVGGRDSASLRAALTVSDLLIIPAAPRSFEVWGVHQTHDLVREARAVHDFRALAVLNCADPNGNDNQEALEALAELEGIEVSPHSIGRRKAFPNAAAIGLSVLEHTDSANRDGSLKAREEFSRFFESIYPNLEERKIA
jgi:chromosome partitioning protein